MKLPLYIYRARVESIHDGDTMTVTLDLGFSTFRRVQLRLAGLDTPEVTGASRDAGRAVLNWVALALHGAKEVTVVSEELDKYGRCLATVYLDGKSLNDRLVSLGMALAYDGGNRAGTWTKAKLDAAAAAAAVV